MKIAIIKLSALGDIIHSAFVLQFIKKSFPTAQIDWFVEESFAQILEHNSDLHSIKRVNLRSIKSDKRAIISEYKRLKEYSKTDYDLIIDMQGLLKSAITARVLGKEISGFDKDSIRESVASYLYRRKFHIPYHLNTIDRYKELINHSLGIKITKEMILAKKPYLMYENSDFEISKPYFLSHIPNVIFIIGANWQSRIYPKENLLEVSKNLDANILIPYANEDERGRGEWLQNNSKNITLLPKMNLNALKALISNSDLVIGNDTGPTYIAWANNIPSIILFGPTPTSRIYESDICKPLKSPSIVDPYRLDKNDFSIKEITPKEIINTAKDLL
jgi:heptosyltransferase-1